MCFGLERNNPQFPEHHFVAEAVGASRVHLLPPSFFALQYSFLWSIRILSGVFRLIANHLTFPPSKARQKQGPFPPPALPGFFGLMALSDSPPAAALTSSVRRRNLRPAAGLPQLLEPPSPHAVLTTPVDRIRGRRFNLPVRAGLPRTNGGSASTNLRFEACSSFMSRPVENSPFGRLKIPHPPSGGG